VSLNEAVDTGTR